MTWKIKQIGKLPKLKNPILIEGLPGIGNVGKVAVDFIIDETKAKKLFSFFSYTFPHSVFVNDDNLVELPSISIYYKKFNNKIIFYANGKKVCGEKLSSFSIFLFFWIHFNIAQFFLFLSNG